MDNANVAQTPMDGINPPQDDLMTLENGVEALSVTSTTTPKPAPTYDELFPALPSSDGGPTVQGVVTSTTTAPSTGGWSNAARVTADSMTIPSSIITQVFHVPQEERAKIDGNNQFGESATSSFICTDITKKTGAHIEISSAKDHSLTFLVTGKRDAVTEARKMVLEKFQAQSRSSIKIPKEHHKFLLGKKGKKLQELEAATGTKIKVPAVNDNSDTVTIIGTKDCIDKAIHEIRVLSDEQSKQSVELIDIPKMYHPFVTGGANANLTRLQNEHGVRINVPPPSVTDKTEISIVGEKESVIRVKAILAKIHKDMERRCEAVSVEVPKMQHKYIIGTRGATIAEILETHNVSVEMPPQDSPSSTITLRGPQENLGAGLTAVYDRASSMIQLNVDAPAWLHRYIIGRKGANINKITTSHKGVHIEFNDEGDTIKLDGPKEEVHKAAETLETIVADMQSRLTQTEMMVDSKYHKHIIGKNGVNINKIRSETNVIINIDPKGSNVIKLEGTPETVQQVREELEALVAKMQNEKEREITIESRLHRNIIGTRGENIKVIREQFNQVQISFPDASRKTDVVKIRGPKEDVDACYKHLQKLVKDLLENNFQIKVPVFKQVMKFVIGKAGVNINKIRDETNTRIEFVTNEQGTDDIIIVGRKENCEKAKQLIQKIQEEQANVVEIDIIVPAKYHNSIIGAKGKLVHSISEECGGVSIKFPKADKRSDKVTIRGPKEDVFKAKKILVDMSNEKQESGFTEDLKCKWQHHKFLIGKSGASIKELREKTGARVLFPSDRDEDKETITVIGKKEQVAAAKAILEKRIKELDNTSESTVQVPQKHHLHFVARRGEVLRQLGDQYGGVSISFPRNGSNSDVVTIKGASQCVEGAKARILEIVAELDSMVALEIVIPQRHHRTIMGQRGINLQNITSRYGVDIKFPERPRNPPPIDAEAPEDGGPQDIIKIRGPGPMCQEAKEALMELVPVVEEVVVPFKFHRYIIGQRGQSVRAFMDAHDVNVQIPPAQNQSDIIKITGTTTKTKDARAALEEQVKKLEEEELDKQARSHRITMNVAAEYHPKIIGRRGAIVSKIRDEFGVNIQFPQKDDEDPTLIAITGYEGKCEEARQAILKITRDLESMIKDSLDIDSRIHSRLIGQRGKAIRKVMDDYKVSISFPRDDENPNTVVITGAEANVNDCRDHLLNLAEEYMLDIQDREDLNQYTNSSLRPLNLVANIQGWADPVDGADASWGEAEQQQVNGGVESAPTADDSRPMANGTKNKHGFVVSGAPWAQEAPNVNSSKDFPSMGGPGSAPMAPSAWGPKRI